VRYSEKSVCADTMQLHRKRQTRPMQWRGGILMGTLQRLWGCDNCKLRVGALSRPKKRRRSRFLGAAIKPPTLPDVSPQTALILAVGPPHGSASPFPRGDENAARSEHPSKWRPLFVVPG